MNSRVVQRNMFFGAKRDIFEIAKYLRKNMTRTELILWKKLKDRDLFKFKFRRQHPIDIFIVDFYCHELKLVIEVDGEIHNIDTKDYDLGRESDLNRFGITVLRFTNEQVIFNMNFVVSAILAMIRELGPLQGAGTEQSEVPGVHPFRGQACLL
jgi:very-short-patch-repair endonuclease